MICKNCSHENAPEEKVCANCGTPLVDEETAEEIELADVVDKTPIDVIDESEAIQDEVIDVIDEEDVIEEAVATCDKEPEKKPKILPFSGLIALIVIAIGLWISFTGIFAPKYESPVDRSKYAVSYIKEGALYQKPISAKSVKLSDSLTANADEAGLMSYSYIAKQSKDGKTTYFLEEFDSETFSGTLYVSYNGKDKIKIADNVVQNYTISEDGKTVMYMSNLNIDTASGTLYYYRKGGEPQIVANNSVYQTWAMSQNGKRMAFVENIDTQTGLGELYVVKAGKKPTKIDDEIAVIAKISDKGEVVYLKNMNETTYSYDMYKASASKSPVLISTGVADGYIMTSKFSDKLGFITVSEDDIYNLNYAEGSSSSLVMEDLMGFFTVDIENENFLLAKASETGAEGFADMHLKKKNKDAVNIAQSIATPKHAKSSLDLKTIYYMNEYDQTTATGTLHVRKETLFGAKDKVIATDVSSFSATTDGRVVVYTTNIDNATGVGTLVSYSNGKLKTIAENAFVSTFKLSQNGKKVTYIGDINNETLTGTLYSASTTGSSKAKAIDTDVYATFYSRSDKNAIYLKNVNSENGAAEIYMWKGQRKPEAIDTGVIALLFE